MRAPMSHRDCQLIVAAYLSLTTLCVATGQTGGSTAPKQTTPTQRKTAAPDDGWWAAQRDIEAAINQLEKYLRESPNGSHAPAARQQLAALRSLSITRSQPEWVPMRALALPDVPLWRVAGIEVLNDRARATIEIKCGRSD